MGFAMTEAEMKEKLDKLLKRRDDYFLITDLERRIYRKQFEEMQEEIIRLKLLLDIYFDELDIFEVAIMKAQPDAKDYYKILDEAVQRREVRWVLKKYFYERAVYVGVLRKEPEMIQNEWLREICIMHRLKRDGHIQCPWPTKLHEKRADDECTWFERKGCD